MQFRKFRSAGSYIKSIAAFNGVEHTIKICNLPSVVDSASLRSSYRPLGSGHAEHLREFVSTSHCETTSIQKHNIYWFDLFLCVLIKVVYSHAQWRIHMSQTEGSLSQSSGKTNGGPVLGGSGKG